MCLFQFIFISVAGQVLVWFTVGTRHHLYRWRFMYEIYNYACLLTTPGLLKCICQVWFAVQIYVHHHHFSHRQRRVSDILLSLDPQWIYPAADSLNYSHMSTTLRRTPPRLGWPLRKRSIITLVGVSQHAFFAFLIMTGPYLFNMLVLFCDVILM